MFPVNPVDGQEWQNPISSEWWKYDAALGQWLPLAGPSEPPLPPGRGLPQGGALGQLLAKRTAADFDVEWSDAFAGGSYVYTQAVPDNEWQITHNLGVAYVRPQVVDGAGNTLIPDIRYTSTNVVTLLFATPCAGTAVLR
jgi:hypothetical protein